MSTPRPQTTAPPKAAVKVPSLERRPRILLGTHFGSPIYAYWPEHQLMDDTWQTCPGVKWARSPYISRITRPAGKKGVDLWVATTLDPGLVARLPAKVVANRVLMKPALREKIKEMYLGQDLNPPRWEHEDGEGKEGGEDGGSSAVNLADVSHVTVDSDTSGLFAPQGHLGPVDTTPTGVQLFAPRRNHVAAGPSPADLSAAQNRYVTIAPAPGLYFESQNNHTDTQAHFNLPIRAAAPQPITAYTFAPPVQQPQHEHLLEQWHAGNLPLTSPNDPRIRDLVMEIYTQENVYLDKKQFWSLHQRLGKTKDVFQSIYFGQLRKAWWIKHPEDEPGVAFQDDEEIEED